MAKYVVTTDSLSVMADAVIFVLDYARANPDDFIFGPMNKAALMSTGLELKGDTEALVAALREAVPAVTISPT